MFGFGSSWKDSQREIIREAYDVPDYSAFVGPGLAAMPAPIYPPSAYRNVYAGAQKCEYCGTDPGLTRHCENCGAPQPARSPIQYGYGGGIPDGLSTSALLGVGAACALYLMKR